MKKLIAAALIVCATVAVLAVAIVRHVNNTQDALWCHGHGFLARRDASWGFPAARLSRGSCFRYPAMCSRPVTGSDAFPSSETAQVHHADWQRDGVATRPFVAVYESATGTWPLCRGVRNHGE